jgi:predicted TIM-barrel fold metal-dependent hydrolase
LERSTKSFVWNHGTGQKTAVVAKPGQVCDIWMYEDYTFPLFEVLAVAGGDVSQMDNSPITYESIPAGVKEQSARLDDMSQNHVEAAACFPNTLPRFCGQTFAERSDHDLALWCLQAYNDWIIDEWCAGDGKGRLIPVTIAPLWDVQLAVREVERCAEKGSYALSFTGNPARLGLPSMHSGYWEPLFQTCADTSTTLCIHVGSSSHVFTTSTDAPFILGSSLAYVSSMGSLLDFIFSGVLSRIPNLKLMYSEGQAGWMPYLIEQADKFWFHRGNNRFGHYLDQPPSSFIPGRVYACIYDDDTALRERDVIGMDQLCYETDYPHADGSFPNSQQAVAEMIMKAGLTAEETYKFVRGNAIQAFGLERFGIDK